MSSISQPGLTPPVPLSDLEPIGATINVVTGTRALDTEYTNSGETPLMVYASVQATVAAAVDFLVDQVTVSRMAASPGAAHATSFMMVPAGSTYEVEKQGGGAAGLSLALWAEQAL